MQPRRWSKLSVRAINYLPQAGATKPALTNITASTLVTLPSELRLKIFKLLDRVSSTCLGLCAKTLYAVHYNLRGKVPLYAWYSSPPSMVHGLHLSDLLKEWNGPKFVVKWPHVKLRPKGLPWHSGLPAGKEAKVLHIIWYNFVRSRAMKSDLRELGGYWQQGEWVPLKNNNWLAASAGALVRKGCER
jgi:hypothetical protein